MEKLASLVRRRLRGPVQAGRHRVDNVRRLLSPDPVSGQPALVSRYGSLLPDRHPRVVVLLADHETGDELAAHLACFPGDRVVVLAEDSLPEWRLDEFGAAFEVADDVQADHRQLTYIGPVDILVNLRRADGEAHLVTWQRLFFHLRRRGLYVVPRQKITGDGEGLLERLRELATYVGAPASELEALPKRRREYARSINELVIATDLVLVGKRRKHLLKVKDNAETIRVLRRRNEDLSVTPLAKLKRGTLTGSGTVMSHEASVSISGLDEQIPYPPLFLRRYEGRIAAAPGAVVHHDHSIFPDSFRWHLEKNPNNPRLLNVDARFARLRDQHRPVTELPGSYYYLDYSNSGHFGHLMTEAVAKFWGWDIAKRADPDLKALVRIRKGDPNRPDPQLDTRLLEAYGVSRSDIVWVDEPVWVQSLVGATPMWHNRFPYYAHPAINDVWSRLRQGIVDDDAPAYSRIFASRRVGNRRCRNVDEVEEFFAAHGFEIIHPEQFDLPQQAGIFANAEVVAGFGGSNLFNLLYARRLRTLIVLNQEAYDSRNEHLFASVLGVDSHYFWSQGDLKHPDEDWSYAAFQSDWEFDFARNKAELERVLGNL